MPAKSSAAQDSLVVAVGLTLAGVGIAAFYLTNDERTKSRWQRDTNSRLNPRSSSSNRGGDASRYPYVARDRNRLRSSSSVRYGKDGRRTLLGTSSTTSRLSVASEEAKEEGVFFDPRQQALSSGDMLLHVLHFLERRDVLSCGIVSTLFRQTATDDTIWVHYAKEFASRNIDSVHAGPSLLRNAGLDSVMDMLYAGLPKDYLEICRHWTPSRERAASGTANKSWHRWLLTMAWLRRARQQEAEKRAPILDSCFAKAIDKYGTMFYFPEQIISFVSSLYRACCEDYWGELIPTDSSEHHQQDVEEQQCPELLRIVRARAPLWGDMLAVLNGYIRLYRGRNFIDWKGNMGFLLQDPASTIVTSNPDGGIRQEDDTDVYPVSTPMRQLQIPCTHGLFMQALASTEERFQGWPYQKQITLDGLLAYIKA